MTVMSLRTMPCCLVGIERTDCATTYRLKDSAIGSDAGIQLLSEVI